MIWQDFLTRGWCHFPADAATLAWARYAHQAGVQALADPANADWLQCEGTWFIGVDALPNDARGQLPAGPALAGPAIDFINWHLGGLPDLHRGQVSSVFPGYPRPRPGEDEAALRYRIKRDAAHVDGVKMFGDARRRRVEEPHAWVLGLPLNDSSPDASPLVIWEGSHVIMRRAFAPVFDGIPSEQWGEVDVTDAYTAARKQVFEICPRVTVSAKPGEAYLMHRLCLHGVAPWAEGASAPEEGRMIAYFRPEMADWTDPSRGWLS
ncbi:phytanoyl-CoA dioxygenase family protein [Phaeobacter gallaeciensis]|uniref:Phytanoyl-CoA dioxygenase n=1 Tax=Phaeobacter gallaeciensis TaxID=60890 RepID=A0AAC9Z8F8_9RHOB|nr:hypothetical protein [Phaeobacter gallaeciensis]AHD09236.1 hypothetical protein Gal_01474 [Phaeobacter gallaeciensis DSM 26640]ATE92499.1 hypothetical protein PhaeoP11_01465 [Phaeobacter gallaeciensis]ATE97679.1 hypothetical protein PhaeoP73_02381 [Phaeobacter gallaeciensis]ATF01164.1 hypothetical protein PhaeoP75_01515 [Phaeobacter gallaeciensis]ATF05544.1 hypothetical protein PhaeoP63_01463 [Phaeobacter gallaeciensis]